MVTSYKGDYCWMVFVYQAKYRQMQNPLESTEGPNIDSQNAFLAQISQIGPSSLHFFDETGMIRTEGNRKYGNSFIGERALEYQKYASKCHLHG